MLEAGSQSPGPGITKLSQEAGLEAGMSNLISDTRFSDPSQTDFQTCVLNHYSILPISYLYSTSYLARPKYLYTSVSECLTSPQIQALRIRIYYFHLVETHSLFHRFLP